jgi:hypothetical protein
MIKICLLNYYFFKRKGPSTLEGKKKKKKVQGQLGGPSKDYYWCKMLSELMIFWRE